MLNRRHIIGGAAALPAIVIASCGATPAVAGSLSPDFAALLDKAAQASLALEAHERDVYLPAKAKAHAAIEALPHTTVHAGSGVTGGQVIWSTDKPTSVAIARSIVDMAREGKDMVGAGLVHARAVTAAHLRRERAAKRIRRAIGCTAAVERSDELGSECCTAQYAVALHPVTTAYDLAAKLAFMIEKDMGDGMDWLEELHADARRIAGLEA
ncbi:hypothetical protein [Sphingomonas sp. Leaf37]|uniref:hypothetical protein n=1 Tax=Sphingomonas sp. Leaf37 TaxID=2876552 RepID=UPI001E332F38|nr:hypothetical protein [Sphingomonas sp. Leaf37]